MDIKYLSDDKGKITGVFIPLEEWERLQKQYNITDAAPADANTKFQESLSAAMKKAKPEAAKE